MIDFEQEVINKSFEKPIVVDFWAGWCGPCQVLGPTIEKLADQAEGKWELVKVDVDQHQDISSQYKIKGIPAVKMFADGEVVGEFTGALPEPQIKSWLEKYIPTEIDKQISTALQLITSGEEKEGREVLEEVVKKEPNNSKASFQLAKLKLFEKPLIARELLSIAEKEPEYVNEALDMNQLIDIILLEEDQLEDHKVKVIFIAGLEALKERNLDRAIHDFIQTIMAYKPYMNEIARKACVSIFNYLGNNHELTRKYRRRFDMALY